METTEAIEITSEQRRILRHTLGLDTGQCPLRNWYCADPTDADAMSALNELVELGLMAQSSGTSGDGWQYFMATERGEDAVLVSTVDTP
ncbi:MAG: hypothetical protein HY749_16080 [Gammaproteobacteria bacterium]|nr:hypothetical protein [Gammaproteobacteria bacterium]